MKRRSKQGKCPVRVLAEACEGSACCGFGIFALAMMLAVPLARADVVLANELVNDLVCLQEKQWEVVCGDGEEKKECCSVDGGPDHDCQED